MTDLRVESPEDGDAICAAVLALLAELRRMQTSGEVRRVPAVYLPGAA